MRTSHSKTTKALITISFLVTTPFLAHADGPDFSGQEVIAYQHLIEGDSPHLQFIDDFSTELSDFWLESFDDRFSLILDDDNFLQVFSAHNPTGHITFGNSYDIPAAPFHFVPPIDETDAAILCDNSNALFISPRNMFELRNAGPPRFVLSDVTQSGQDKYTFAMNPAGNFTMTRAGVAGAEIVVKGNGIIEMGPGTSTTLRVTRSGIQATSYSTLSDKASKTDIREIRSNDILEKLNALPVSTWRFKGDHDTDRHIGPMAQDFHMLFGEGDKEATTINLSDMAGVALAGVKSLDQKVEEKVRQKDAEIAELRDALQQEQAHSKELAERLDRIEAMLDNQ